MRDISPIFLEHAITTAAGGKVKSCRMTKSGFVIVNTHNLKQAKSLIRLTSITTDIKVNVEEHSQLNTAKGVIYGHELSYETEDNLQDYLRSAHVTKVHKVHKTLNGSKVATGTVFLTFGKPELPEYVEIGYERYRVKEYIPEPTRCFTCHKFGHITKVCPNIQYPLCYNCGENKHLTERYEKCNRKSKCKNCNSEEHNSYSRICPEYIKQKEIQKIKTTEKISLQFTKPNKIHQHMQQQQQSKLISTVNVNANAEPHSK